MARTDKERKCERENEVKGAIKSKRSPKKSMGVKTDGKWREEESEGGGGGVAGWLMVDGSSRMRVITKTDVVYSHFPSHHLFCGGGKPRQDAS